MADEGLDFLLELDAKIDGAVSLGTVLKKIDASLKGVDASLKKVEQASGHASKGHAKHAKEAEHAEGILHHFLHATLGPFEEKLKQIAEFEFIRRGVDALLEVPKEAYEMFKELLGEMVKVSAEAERTDKSFELLFGRAEGKETLEWIEGISKYTEFTGKQLKGAAQDLAKVGFKGEDLTRAMAASLDMSAFNKSGEAGMSEALSSLERIKRTGHVDNRALGGLGIGEPEFLAELSRRTGEGVKTLKKKMDEGKIAAEESLEALYSMIARKTGKDLGGAGVEMSTTLEARLNHLKELPERIFEKLKDSQGFAAISDFAGKVLDALDPDGPNGRRIYGAVESIFDKLGASLEGFDLAGTINTFATALEILPTAMKPVIDVMSDLVGILKEAISLISYLPGVRYLIETMKTTAATDKVNRALAKDLDAKIGAGNWGREDSEPAWLKKGEGVGRAMGAGTKKGLVLSTPPVSSAAIDQGTAAERAMRDALGIQSPSKVFQRLGEMTGEGFNRGLDKSIYQTDDVARGAFAMPAPAGGTRGPITVTIDVGGVHVQSTGQGGEHIAKDVAEQLKVILPGALIAAIEQVSGQAGSA